MRSLSLCEIDIHAAVSRVDHDPVGAVARRACRAWTASWRMTAWASPAPTSAPAWKRPDEDQSEEDDEEQEDLSADTYNRSEF